MRYGSTIQPMRLLHDAWLDHIWGVKTQYYTVPLPLFFTMQSAVFNGVATADEAIYDTWMHLTTESVFILGDEPQ